LTQIRAGLAIHPVSGRRFAMLRPFRLRPVILSAVSAVILAACALNEPTPPDIETVNVGPAGLPANTVPVFCYRTLAGADCYHEPIPSPPNRLIGAYLPAEEEDGEDEAE
jgi:hypothetical protein